MEKRHLFNVWVEYKGEKKGLFKKRFSEGRNWIANPTYCFESDILKKYENHKRMKSETFEDCDSLVDWKIVSRELKYKNVDQEYSFRFLSSNLCAEDFLQYCKDNMVTTVIISQ